MNFPLGLASASVASTKRELDTDRIELAGIADRVTTMVGLVPRMTPGEWSGPASMAYAAACDQVARDVVAAIVALRTSGDLLALAIGELDQHG